MKPPRKEPKVHSATRPWNNSAVVREREAEGRYNPDIAKICLECKRKYCKNGTCDTIENYRVGNTMPPPPAELIQLYHEAGVSQKKLAARYGTTVYTVKVWLHQLGYYGGSGFGKSKDLDRVVKQELKKGATYKDLTKKYRISTDRVRRCKVELQKEEDINDV